MPLKESSKAGEKATRAGRYYRQSKGYSAFIPEPLPPTPPINFDDELQTLLSRADRALGRLDGSIQTLPNPDLFILMYVRKEAVLSSQIEGTQSSLNDILEAEASVLERRRSSDATEVLNYVEAMKYGLKRLNELPVSIRLVREIHGVLMDGVRGGDRNPGELRTSQNWIGSSGCALSEAAFVPPPPHIVMETLGKWETFIQSKTDIPVLVKIGLIHSQFETIHPFLDGNGRIGRLLIAFLLCASEVLASPVLYISHYFKQHRAEYYDRLQRVRDYGEWEEWLKFFLEGIAEVSLEATETARNIVGLREHHRSLVTENFGRATGNGLTALEYLFTAPVVSVSDISSLLSITFPAANKIVERFVALKILEEITGQRRYRVFGYRPYINLFSDTKTN